MVNLTGRFPGGRIPASEGKGELAERSNAAVLKTVSPQGLGGSNPSLSARTCPSKSHEVPEAKMKPFNSAAAVADAKAGRLTGADLRKAIKRAEDLGKTEAELRLYT